ncbi:RUS1 family-like protein [Lachnellula hyalina]|uniref:RUS1 family-like protein n=1 Tax=Lachnellula hyalina TaxID=1316788 RepID=A0A8H8R8J3_9HELO|nr:RUS1 family-like protein [Lachnellula hyalina]TVY30540.1 RUS1 family-like protein [Lachnellula hyalina]
MAQVALKEKTPLRLEIEEIDESKNVVATYIASAPNDDWKTSRIDVVVPKNTNSYARSILNAFLPAGYPHSVTNDYLEYQIYDSLQAFSSSIAGLLSSRAVLEGIGVGDSHASPTAALLLSVLQESMGRIATILFAHRLGTSLEPECKMYRLAADIFNDSAMILDCFSPALPKASRVVLLSLSSVLRSLCGIAAGSSKASLSTHFATQGNLGELNAKDSSQETIISLLGMLVGSLVVSHISSKWATWSAMIALLAIHLGTNYLAVRAVSMRTLNRQRANIVSSNIFETVYQKIHAAEEETLSDTDLLSIRIPSPEEVSVKEKVFEKDGVLRWKGGKPLGYCRIGVDVRTILNLFGKPNRSSGSYSEDQPVTFAKLLDIYKDDGYIMWYDEPRKTFLIILKDTAQTTTHLQAWMHALYHAEASKLGRLQDEETVMAAISSTKTYVAKVLDRFAVFEELQKAGWDIETGAMETKSGTRIKLRSL